MTGDQNDRDRIVDCAQALEKCDAIHPRHPDIADHDSAKGAVDHAQRSLRPAEMRDDGTCQFQRLHRRFGEHRVVLHQTN